MITIRTIKLCGNSIYKPLQMIFKSYLNQGIFPAEWKKVSVVSVIRKEIINILKTTDLFLLHHCLAKYLEDSFVAPCLNNF